MAGADPQRRNALEGLQALLRAGRAGRGARWRQHHLRRPLVRRRPRLTRRRSSYRSIASLQRDEGQRAYMFGQAPGVVEGQERLPWRGRAGRTLRRWLGLGEEEFYATFYCASVTRCYPGKAASGRGDRTPTPREQELCAFWREWELRLIRPQLIVPVGGLAARRLLGLKSVTECVGSRFERAGAVAIPLPHPSGTSRWLNDPANRAQLAGALAAVREELARLG